MYGLYLFRLFFVFSATLAQSICTAPILSVGACLRIFRGGCVCIFGYRIGSYYPRFYGKRKKRCPAAWVSLFPCLFVMSLGGVFNYTIIIIEKSAPYRHKSAPFVTVTIFSIHQRTRNASAPELRTGRTSSSLFAPGPFPNAYARRFRSCVACRRFSSRTHR